MALKKSELYSSLWSGCDELRGGMDAGQYKEYVLVLLKYVSDKYSGVPYAPITIPEGPSFADMVALKGKPDIGDQVNKKNRRAARQCQQAVRHAGFLTGANFVPLLLLPQNEEGNKLQSTKGDLIVIIGREHRNK